MGKNSAEININCKDFQRKCDCGRIHSLDLKKVVIKSGALLEFEESINEIGLSGNRAVIYDENTWNAVNERRPEADINIILSPDGLHADERAAAEIAARIAPADYLVAVGAGTIHDATRYCAAEKKIPFVSVPTAASVDGFVSTVAAMTWNGFKITFPAVSPELVVADLDIISNAPFELALSGVGDMAGKHIALADWKISSLLTGEYYCEYIVEIMREALDGAMSCSGRLIDNDIHAYGELIKGLIISGVAMQLSGNSRPASGAEHHISHLLELTIDRLGRNEALHGEKVGIGTILAAREYKNFANSNSIISSEADFKSLPPRRELESIFGTLADDIIEENTPNCARDIDSAILQNSAEDIRAIIDKIPDPDWILDLLKGLGAKNSLEDIGISSEKLSLILRYSPFVRNRLTLMRIISYINNS